MVNLTLRLPIMSAAEQAQLTPALRHVIDYRKSGLSLNHVIGCPLDCAYCVRHFFDNFAMKTPRALMSDEDAVEALVGHEFFQPDATPIQFFNRATDPMLPNVKPHTFRVLRELDRRGLRNHVLVITRWKVTEEDCAWLNGLTSIKLTLLVTHSGISDERIEPVDSRVAAQSLKVAYANAENYRVVQYWRPIVPGLNDSDADISRALELSAHAHATVYTGLFYKDQISDYFRAHGLPEPYADTATRKVFPEQLEQRILDAFRRPDGTYGALFRKTSCGVAYAHQVPDYNGHYGIRELILEQRTPSDSDAAKQRAATLVTLALQYAQVGRTTHGIIAIERGIEALRALPDEGWVSWGALAHAYTLLSELRNSVQPDGALLPAAHAAELWQQVALQRPEHRADLAYALARLADLHQRDSRPNEATSLAQKSLDIWFNLASSGGETLPEGSLGPLVTLSELHLNANRHDEAVAAASSAIKIYRMVEKRQSNSNLVRVGFEFRRYTRALRVLGDAIERGPDPLSLHNGRRIRALRREAVFAWLDLALTMSSGLRRDLADALAIAAHSMSNTGKLGAAALGNLLADRNYEQSGGESRASADDTSRSASALLHTHARHENANSIE